MWQKPQSPCVNLGIFTGVCVQDVMWRVAGFLQEVPPQDKRGSSLLRETRFGYNSLKGWYCHSSAQVENESFFFLSTAKQKFLEVVTAGYILKR